uniref:ABC transporter permease n=1 Tax=Globodera pallida TaxID=36090 RepID=A0A183C7W3_GLOPA
MKFVYQLSAYNRNFVAHILIIERIMATFLRKNYERTAGWFFSIGWITIVFFISLYDSVTTSADNTSIFGLITTLALLILGAIELFVI